MFVTHKISIIDTGTERIENRYIGVVDKTDIEWIGWMKLGGGGTYLVR